MSSPLTRWRVLPSLSHSLLGLGRLPRQGLHDGRAGAAHLHGHAAAAQEGLQQHQLPPEPLLQEVDRPGQEEQKMRAADWLAVAALNAKKDGGGDANGCPYCQASGRYYRVLEPRPKIFPVSPGRVVRILLSSRNDHYCLGSASTARGAGKCPSTLPRQSRAAVSTPCTTNSVNAEVKDGLALVGSWEAILVLHNIQVYQHFKTGIAAWVFHIYEQPSKQASKK